MRLVVGYDRELARVCLRRNLRELVSPGQGRTHNISNEEVEYFTERLLETALFSYDGRFGSPWVMADNSNELLKKPKTKLNRSEIQQCELVANNLLVYEGILRRSGATFDFNKRQAEIVRKKVEICMAFFDRSSLGSFRTKDEKRVLLRMGRNTTDWLRYLSYLQGNDLLQMMSTENFSSVQLN
ncbi:MAG: hypothetical protein V4690_01655 [Patescibacteria group bacterium]